MPATTQQRVANAPRPQEADVAKRPLLTLKKRVEMLRERTLQEHEAPVDVETSLLAR